MTQYLQNNGAHQLQDLFEAPMLAVINADIELSRRVTDFIINYGFEKEIDYNSDILNIKMVNFSYVANGEIIKFSIPVLSLIQLPLLHIKSAEFDMKVKLFTVSKNEEKKAPEFLKSTNIQLPKPKAKISAYLAPNSNDPYETTKSNMHVKLNMVDGDLPGGMIQLLALMNNLHTKNNSTLNI